MAKTLIVDLREEVELLDVQVKSNVPDTVVVNIPARNMFGSIEFINSEMEHYQLVYLLCRSGKRAKAIKQRYFPHLQKVEVFPGGWKAIDANKSKYPTLKLMHTKKMFNYGPQQYMQFVIVAFLTALILMLYFKVDRKYVMMAVGAMAVFIAWQVVTKSCLMTSFIPYQ